MAQMTAPTKISGADIFRMILFVSFCLLFAGGILGLNQFWRKTPERVGHKLKEMGILYEGPIQLTWNFPKGFSVDIPKALFQSKSGRFLVKDVNFDIRYHRVHHRLNFKINRIHIKQAIALDPLPNDFEMSRWELWRKPLLTSALASIPYVETEIASIMTLLSYVKFRIFFSLDPSEILIDEVVASETIKGFSVRESKQGKQLLEKRYLWNSGKTHFTIIEDFERQKRAFEFKSETPEIRLAGESSLADLSWISFEGQLNNMPAEDFNRLLSESRFFDFNFENPQIPSGKVFLSAEGVARETSNKKEHFYLALQAQGALDVRDFKINSTRLLPALTKEFFRRPGFWALKKDALDQLLKVNFDDQSAGKLRTAFEISPDQLQIVEFYMENQLFKASFIRAPWVWKDHTLKTSGQLVFSEEMTARMTAVFPFFMAWANDKGRMLLPMQIRTSGKEIKVEIASSEIDAVYRLFLKPIRFSKRTATTYQEVRTQLNEPISKGDLT